MWIFFTYVLLLFAFGDSAEQNINFGSFVKSTYLTPLANGIRIKYVPSNQGSPVISGYSQLPSEYKNEITLEYDVLFENGFEWVRGGKLPGLRGGDIKIATTGCVKPQSPAAWSIRTMWKPDGAVILYIYDQSRIKNNDDCGISTMSGKGILKINQWMNFKIYMKINTDAKSANGVAKLYINNKLTLEKKNIKFRGISNGADIDHIMFSTFYGGHDPSWAPSKVTYSQFKNAKIYNKDIFALKEMRNATWGANAQWECKNCGQKKN